MNTIEYSTDENVPAHINAEFAKMRKDAERQKEASKAAGRYTLEEAANLLEKQAGERAGPMLDKLKAAAASRALPTYEPGKNARYAGKVVREFYEEAHAEDLNAWLEANEPRIVWRFTPGSLTPESAPAVEAATIAGPGTMRHSTKGKRAQPLSAEIEAAKREATNPDDAHAVYAVLQRWANEDKAPFLGFVEGAGCKYQTLGGEKFFTLDALRKRMNRAAKAR